MCCITVLVFQHLQYHHHPIYHPHHTAFTRCTLSSFARNVTRFGAIVASPLKSVRITVRIVFSRCQVPAYAPRRTGVPKWSSFHSKVCSDASIRCARNCFMCPNCRNTLSVVPSDPPDTGETRLPIPISSLNEPPFFLYCNHCRWDSAEVGITFEKPTGLAG